jgi:inner membrane protein
MEVLNWLAGYGAWSWVIGGLVLLGLELVVPGGILLWLGLAGVATGIIAFLIPISWPMQALVFGVLALLALFAWLKLSRGRAIATDRPYLNRRAERFVGHEAVLDEPIRDGYGRVALGDTVWRVAGPDLEAGRKVRIVGHDGAVLKVEALG